MDHSWSSQAVLVAYMAVLGLLCIYGMHRYFLVLTFYRVRNQPPRLDAHFDELPTVTVQLPMFNEQYVAQRIIEQACRIDYPADKLEIQVLDDSTDETVGIANEAVERLKALGHNVVHVHRANRLGYKAGALEEGARTAMGEFIAIFDADFMPPPNILRDTVHYFTDPKVGAVQCRWDHLNRESSLLTSAQAILLDGHFMIEHTARNRTGRFMSFNGTAGVWRKSAIADAGGWQHDTLTEDLDLSYRAQLRDWRIVFLRDLTAPAELPPEMNAFKAQQHRWTKGGAQTCVKLLPSVLRSARSWRVKLEAIFHLTSCFVYILMVLLSVLLGPALIAKLSLTKTPSPLSWLLDFSLFFIGTGSALSFYIVSQRALMRDWKTLLKQLPGLMAIGVGIGFNNAFAAVEGFFGKSGEFVRTPKFGDEKAGGENWKRRLGGLRSRTSLLKAIAEMSLAIYLTLCTATLFLYPDWLQRVSLALPFVGLFIFGYGYVAIQTFYGLWLAGRRSSATA